MSSTPGSGRPFQHYRQPSQAPGWAPSAPDPAIKLQADPIQVTSSLIPDPLLDSRQAGERLGVSDQRVNKLVNSGELAAEKVAGYGRGRPKNLIRLSEIERYKAAKVASQTEFEKRARTGVLAAELLAGCEEGYTMDELTAMSVANDPFRLDTPAGHRDGEWFKDQVLRLLGPIDTIHIRGLHYRLIMAPSGVIMPNGAAYLNNEWCYTFLEEASKAARWLNYVAFERIRDERNDPPEIYAVDYSDGSTRAEVESSHTDPLLDIAAEMPELQFFGSPPIQDYRIVMIGEKSSLRDILDPIAALVHGELILPTGNISDTLLSDIERRAAADGCPLVVLYFSDFDPSGFHMPTEVARKLQALRIMRNHDHLDIQVHSVCLTYEQAVALDLPSTPIKDSDRRKDKWFVKWGREQTEIDALVALRPETLREIAITALEPFFDFTLEERWEYEFQQWQRECIERAQAHESFELLERGIHNARDMVNERLAAARELVSLVQGTREVARDLLAEVTLPVFTSPQPEIEAEVPEPIYSSDDDFVTASRRLRERKELYPDQA
jgi:hypothetical protein